MNRMPVVFVGHGSPMNAITENDFTASLRALAASLPEPRAILAVSAHWLTEGSWVTHMGKPRTIHDFYGFPAELASVSYPAPGSPWLAELARSTVKDPLLQLDDEQWGLDHGAWAVLRKMFPDARVPVVQLSLDRTRDPDFHFRLGTALRPLREQGVLIVASGNVVHNLRRIRWEAEAEPYDWAREFDGWVADRLRARDFTALTRDFLSTEAARLSVPTTEHYLPLLYAIGAAEKEEPLRTAFEGVQNGSISMRTFVLGA